MEASPEGLPRMNEYRGGTGWSRGEDGEGLFVAGDGVQYGSLGRVLDAWEFVEWAMRFGVRYLTVVPFTEGVVVGETSQTDEDRE